MTERDEKLNDALWDMLTTEPDRAIGKLDIVQRSFAALPPSRLGASIALAAKCTRRDLIGWLQDSPRSREQIFCDFQARQGARR